MPSRGLLDYDPTPNSKMYVWFDHKGGQHNKATVFESSEQYLKSTGMLAKWPKNTRILAPYNFWIVSITPTVIVMEPSSAPIDSGQFEPYIATYELLNRIQYGTSLPTADNLEWFSPDLNQGPSPVTFSPSGVAVISLPGGKLVLTRVGNQCRVVRE